MMQATNDTNDTTRAPWKRPLHPLCSGILFCLALAGCAAGSGAGDTHGTGGEGAGGSSSTSEATSSGSGGGATTGGGGSTSVTYQPVTIDFSDLPDGTSVTTQYAPHATFSDLGGEVLTMSGDFGQKPPVFVCTDSGECDTGLTVVFGKPVKNLTFDVLAVNDTGSVADVLVFQNGAATATATAHVMGTGNLEVPVVVDLSAYPGITSIQVVNITDEAGVGFAVFSFDYPS